MANESARDLPDGIVVGIVNFFCLLDCDEQPFNPFAPNCFCTHEIHFAHTVVPVCGLRLHCRHGRGRCVPHTADERCQRSLAKHSFRSRSAARRSVFEYIEGWYNPRRRHSALGYLSPMNFEKRMEAVA